MHNLRNAKIVIYKDEEVRIFGSCPLHKMCKPEERRGLWSEEGVGAQAPVLLILSTACLARP